MEKKYHYTYQTINIITNKTYIGVHSTNNLNDGYIGCGIYNDLKAIAEFNRRPKHSPFVNSVVKYGYNNFHKIILNFYDTRQEALEEEEFLVDENWIKCDNNYNVALGGKCKKPILKNGRKIYQYDLQGNYINTFENIEAVRKYFNTTSNLATLYNCFNPNNNRQITYNGFQWSIKLMDDLGVISKPKTLKRRVKQIDKEGNTINIFDRIKDFEQLNFDPSSISKVCRGINKYHKGYRFEYIS